MNLSPEDARVHSIRLFNSLTRDNARRAAWPINSVMKLLDHLGLPDPLMGVE